MFGKVVIMMSDKQHFDFLKVYALSNPKGTVKAFGKWDGTEDYIDIIGDIKKSLSYLDNIPRVILMSANTYSCFVSRISFSCLRDLGEIFGCVPSDKSWLDVNNQYDDDCVIIVARIRNPYRDSGPDTLAVLIKIR